MGRSGGNEALIAEIEALHRELTLHLPELAAARRRFAPERREVHWPALEAAQARAEDLQHRMKALVDRLGVASGLPPDLLEQLGEYAPPPRPDRRPRSSLAGNQIAPTADLDAVLPAALTALKARVPSGNPSGDGADARLKLDDPTAFLCLGRNLRQESETPTLHRWQQLLRVSEDRLDRASGYDHFAGASLVPAAAALGSSLGDLDDVPGATERIEHLWRGPSEEVDSTIYELLVGAACVRLGRKVEFLATTSDRTPDLRCHDPFPLVIECKRQRGHLDFERAELATMRDVFSRLRARAASVGLFGCFRLRLNVLPAQLGDLDDLVATLLRQRLGAHPGQPLAYAWGDVAFDEVPRMRSLITTTRPYSPELLRALFDYDTDLPKWDGLCCAIEDAAEATIDRVRDPLGLVWINDSPEAVHKRTWAPVNLFGQAMGQVPPGEFGIIYTAYSEGARAPIADARLEAFTSRLKAWSHDPDIRVPLAFLDRLYPRPLGSGEPDLIESGVRFCSAVYGEPVLFEQFPTVVYTADSEVIAPTVPG